MNPADEGLTNQVDIYQPLNRTWTTSRPLMFNRSGFTACIVRDLPNPEAYAHVIRLMENKGLVPPIETTSDVSSSSEA